MIRCRIPLNRIISLDKQGLLIWITFLIFNIERDCYNNISKQCAGENGIGVGRERDNLLTS